MFNFIKLKVAAAAKLVPGPLKKVLKAAGAGRFYSRFMGKYASELASQMRWAEAYNGKSDLLKRDLKAFWKEHRCLDEISSRCRISEGTRILDIGCGIATVLHILEGERHGVDPLADEYLNMYRYPEGIKVRKGFGEDLPFPDGSFDVVFCSNVLDHVTEPRATVREAHRVLREGGKFILVVELFDASGERNPAHPHSLTESEAEALLDGLFERSFWKVVPWPQKNNFSKGVIAVLERKP